MICWALQHSNDEVLKFGRICVQEMMGGLLYFTQLHLMRCTTHTHQTAQPLFAQGTILTASAGRPCGNHCRIKLTFEEPLEFFYSTYVDSKWTQQFFFEIFFLFFIFFNNNYRYF